MIDQPGSTLVIEPRDFATFQDQGYYIIRKGGTNDTTAT